MTDQQEKPKAEQSPDEALNTDASKDSKEQKQSEWVPYGRFAQVDARMKEYKAELDAIKTTFAEQKKQQAEAETERQRQLAEQGQYKELLEARQKELDETRQQLQAIEAERATERLKHLRLQVATEKGLPALLAGRLQGSTKEELEADADTLLKTIPAVVSKPTPPAPTGAAGTGQRGEKPQPKLTFKPRL